MEDFIGIERVKRSLKLIKENLKELENVEYILELLEKELNEYRSLVDRETYIPKVKFVKERVKRLIERMEFSGRERFVCFGIKIDVTGHIDPADRRSIVNYAATFIDKHIRPGDIIFKLDEDIVGIIFVLKNLGDIEAVERRLKSVISSLKAKTYGNRNLITFRIGKLFIDRGSSVEEVFERLTDSLRRE